MEHVSKIRTLCVIPARGGSKGLPNKNLLQIRGKPLLSFPIEYAKSSKHNLDIIVSTDSQQIGDLALKHGAQFPFIRPSELSQDLSTTESVLQHAIEFMESERNFRYDYGVFLTPTSIFRPPGLIDKGIAILNEKPQLQSFFSGYPTTKNYWTLDDSGYWTRLLPWMREYSSRQIREVIVREDTGICSVSRAEIWRSGRRIGDQVHIDLNDDEFSSIDIHSFEDFLLASSALSLRESEDDKVE